VILQIFIGKCNTMPINMLVGEVRALLALSVEPRSVRQLAEAVGCKYRRAGQITGQLLQKGFVVRADGLIRLADTPHAVLFKKISRRYDVAKLLGDSKEDVALALLYNNDVAHVQGQTGLTYWTVRRALNRMMETGAVRERDRRYFLADDEDLRLFLRLWMEERQRRLVEPYAEVIYATGDTVLKRVPEGKIAKGSLTAFSVFSKYGVELRPVYSYYVQPERELGVEDVLVHAMVFSTNPVELTDCAIFYVKNRGSINLAKVRKLAKAFNVGDVEMDLENYVRNLTIASPEKFLPWDEFAEKARLYDISPEDLVPPTAFPWLTGELAKHAKREVRIYIFGGEAMRVRGLKRATKDVDVVVEDAEAYATLREALAAMGYRTLVGEEISKADTRLNPSGIFIREGYPRVDLFVNRICNAFYLSDSMKKRCESTKTGNLSQNIMSNEDVFLLKSITDREGDIYDMIQLAKAKGFDWRTVLNELYDQEKSMGRHFCWSLLDSVEVIEEKANIRPPFYNQLLNHCIDQAILDSVTRWKATTMKQIREFINFPDYRLKSRIRKLVKEGRLTELGRGQFTAKGDDKH